MSESKYTFSEIIQEIESLPCSHPASVNRDVAIFYSSLTKMVRPLLVVEIGCFIGFSTLHFAKALKEQGFGRMISIDPFDWDVDTGNGMENREVVARRYWKKAEMQRVVTFVKGTSASVYSEIEEEIKQGIDLLYIDGDHTINGAFYDFNRYYNDVRPGGIIVLHDIYPEMCSAYGPRALLDCLKNSGHLAKNIELIEFPSSDGFGIAVLRKVRSKPVKLRIPLSATPKSFLKRAQVKLRSKLIQRYGDRLNIHTGGPRLTIVDQQDDKPIVDALFTCPQRLNESRRSDKRGNIYLGHYLPNRYLVHLTAEGYEPLRDFMLDIRPSPKSRQLIIRMKKKEIAGLRPHDEQK